MRLENMPLDQRDKIVANIINGFLATLGIVPSVGGFEVKERPPHTIFVQQARIPDALVDRYDADDYFKALEKYLVIHNRVATGAKLGAYGVEIYTCPCGCGDFLYVSVYI